MTTIYIIVRMCTSAVMALVRFAVQLLYGIGILTRAAWRTRRN